MGALYVASLLVGLGVLLGASLLGGHGDAGHELVAHDHAGDAVHALGALRSVRFWAFFALAFGMTGAGLTFFALAHPLTTLALAGGMGLGSGALVLAAVRLASRAVPLATTSDAVGRTGRVLVDVSRERLGQVRVALEGRSVDLRATTEGDPLPRGAAVLVEDVADGVARVSPRPEELA